MSSGLRFLTLVAMLLTGCLESPYGAAPVEHPCGDLQRPCPITCAVPCFSAVRAALSSCALTLEGSLSADETRCTFADQSEVRFALPVSSHVLPPAPPPLDVTIRQGGAMCVSARVSAPDKTTAASSADNSFEDTEVTLPGVGTYRQRVRRPAAALVPAPQAPDRGASRDGGAQDGPLPLPSELWLSCPGGLTYAAVDETRCEGCAGGQCRAHPLLALTLAWDGSSLELRLHDGDASTLLFACR